MTAPPDAWLDWAVKGIGGVLGIAERGVRGGGVVSGESAELLRMYRDRIDRILAGDAVPENIRSTIDYWRWRETLP